jgi:hypothetical protein
MSPDSSDRDIEFTREIENLTGRVKRIEDELAAEHEKRAKDISVWKAGVVGVAFALLLQALQWLWRHLKP